MADEQLTPVETTEAETVGASPKKTTSKVRRPKKATPAANKQTIAEPAPTRMRIRYSPEERTKILTSIEKSLAGGKMTLKPALKEAGISEQTYYNWKRNADRPAQEVPVRPVDTLKDLVELEAENQQLRKELAEKLRAENAELRRRLGK